MIQFDLAIIGAGPAGYNAAENAASNGLKTVLFEKKVVGGVCLNEGCIPTKSLLYSAKMLDTVKSAGKYGIGQSGETGFDYPTMVARKDRVVKQLTAGVGMKLQACGVTTVEGEAQIIGEQDGLFLIRCGDEQYQAAYLLIATGSESVTPPIKGLSEVPFWTSREALAATALPQSLLIIGGGVIGMEFASLFNSMGVKVTVVELLPEILASLDKESAAMLRKIYTKKGVDFKLGYKVMEASASSVVVEKSGKKETLATEQILLSVGRRPIVKGFGLENLQLEMDGNSVKTNEYMQTSHPRVYLAGDITGLSMLAHTAIREGEVAIGHMLGNEEKMHYRAIPGVVYTNPEIAGVGATEEELTREGTYYRTLQLPMAYSGRFVAENENLDGFCKIIINAQEQIIGCHMLGNPCSEIILLAGMAIEHQLNIDEFKRSVFPHPTVGEIIHECLNL